MLAILSIEWLDRFKARPPCVLHAVVDDGRLATIALLFVGAASDEDRIFFVTDGKVILDTFPRDEKRTLAGLEIPDVRLEIPDVRIAMGRAL